MADEVNKQEETEEMEETEETEETERTSTKQTEPKCNQSPEEHGITPQLYLANDKSAASVTVCVSLCVYMCVKDGRSDVVK